MGRRASYESLAAVFLAFLRQHTWTQAALAKEVGVTVPALRRVLEDVGRHGLPLERDEDHPHVYWSVPHGWFPGGVAFDPDESRELLRQLLRAPASAARNRLIERLLAALPARQAGSNPQRAVIELPASDSEEAYLGLIEDAAAQRIALRMKYFSASRGAVSSRHVSVQKIDIARPVRFVGFCHRDQRLKWFRVDNVVHAALDPGEPYRGSPEAEVAEFVRSSLDGFHRAGAAAVPCAFFVANPEARWVERNLLPGMNCEPAVGGVRVRSETSAVLRLARYVVGLGAAAQAETPELARFVEALARGALHGEALDETDSRAYRKSS